MFSAKIREKSIGKMRSKRLLAVLLVPAVALIMGAAAPQAWAWLSTCVDEEGEEVGLDESAVFFEFNSTDCDVGIQIFWDGEPWSLMVVKDENGRAVLNVFPRRTWRNVGLTEGLFEGAEPPVIEDGVCNLEDPIILGLIEEFIKQFKAGPYTFKGIAAEESCLLLGDAELTYGILEPVVFTKTDLPNIEWDAPSGLLFGGSSEVVGYEMVIELVVMENGDERVFKETTTLPGDATSYLVSDTFMDLIYEPPGDIVELKIEILADEESGNRTITEEEVELE